jgi:Glycosyltransferase family 87
LTNGRGRWALWAFVALFAVYAVVVILLGVHKGDDLVAEITEAQRLLGRQMLNTAPPTQGLWWPPFGTLLVAPFALVANYSLPLAKALWGAFSALALAWAIAKTWRLWGWRPALIAFAIVAFPTHNNFHHLNIETILLALAVATAADLSQGRSSRAGVWAGLATALKVFPGLLLVYFAVRRQWTALLAGVAACAGATLVALLPLGPAGMVTALRNYATLATHSQNYQGGTVAALHMQKLGKLGYALGGAPASIVLLHLLAVGLVATILIARPKDDDAPLEVGSVLLLAVLLTPIAWLHTFTLGYLAWVAVFAYVPPEGVGPRRAWRWCRGASAIYASTALTALHLPVALGFVTFHDDTIGALVALALLAWLRIARARQAAPTLAGSPQPV